MPPAGVGKTYKWKGVSSPGRLNGRLFRSPRYLQLGLAPTGLELHFSYEVACQSCFMILWRDRNHHDPIFWRLPRPGVKPGIVSLFSHISSDQKAPELVLNLNYYSFSMIWWVLDPNSLTGECLMWDFTHPVWGHMPIVNVWWLNLIKIYFWFCL